MTQNRYVTGRQGISNPGSWYLSPVLFSHLNLCDHLTYTEMIEKEKKLWILGGMFEIRFLHASGREKE